MNWVEIELSDGSVRRGKVLEVNGDSAVVQLFEANAGDQFGPCQGSFPGASLQLAVSRDMLGRVFNGMGQPIDGGRKFWGGISGYQRFGDESCGPGLSQ